MCLDQNTFLTSLYKLKCSSCDASYHGDAVLLLAEVFLLCFLEKVLPSADG